MSDSQLMRPGLAAAYEAHGLDMNRASVARMYDYMLGGKDNYAVDREAVAQVMVADPDVLSLVRENRAFVVRATRLMAEAGIDQFLDVGSGMPTAENVHQVAQGVNPDARTVYIDNDPIVLVHGQAILADNPLTTVVTADLRDPAAIIDNPHVGSFIDWSRPVGILSVATLHFVPDEDDPWATMAALREVSVPGSYLAISHATSDTVGETVGKVAEAYQRTAGKGTPRTREQVLRFFEGYELLDPGLTLVSQWRPPLPIPQPERYWFYAGVGRR
ncbi:MAG: SAM-dependent methyltransferase [Nocardiopsaceae bacterium]|nr:SAM-dependent methyltransferase [Nocardiopsaceae bacterium]